MRQTFRRRVPKNSRRRNDSVSQPMSFLDMLAVNSQAEYESESQAAAQQRSVGLPAALQERSASPLPLQRSASSPSPPARQPSPPPPSASMWLALPPASQSPPPPPPQTMLATEHQSQISTPSPPRSPPSPFHNDDDDSRQRLNPRAQPLRLFTVESTPAALPVTPLPQSAENVDSPMSPDSKLRCTATTHVRVNIRLSNKQASRLSQQMQCISLESFTCASLKSV
jgi:hypothetical protein